VEQAAPAMARGSCRDRYCAPFQALSGRELGHRRKTSPHRASASASRDDHLRITFDEPERRRVEVIVVHVRDKHEIDASDLPEVHGGRVSHDVRGPRPEHRIGQHADAIEIDQDRGVADPRDLQGGANASRRGFPTASFVSLP
jgi:hypothetical protein